MCLSSSREKVKEEEGLLALPGEKWNENQWVGIRYLRTKTRRRNKTNCRCGAAQCGSHKRRFADVTGDFVPRTLNPAVLGAPKFFHTCYSLPGLLGSLVADKGPNTMTEQLKVFSRNHVIGIRFGPKTQF